MIINGVFHRSVCEQKVCQSISGSIFFTYVGVIADRRNRLGQFFPSVCGKQQWDVKQIFKFKKIIDYDVHKNPLRLHISFRAVMMQDILACTGRRNEGAAFFRCTRFSPIQAYLVMAMHGLYNRKAGQRFKATPHKDEAVEKITKKW